MEGRIITIDILRGITIILVVLYHLDNIIFQRAYQCVFDVVETFMLPIFFFITGYLSYKDRFSSGQTNRLIFKRAIMLLYPTVVICSIFFICLHGMHGDSSIISVPFNPYKGGYWYTIVAFEMYLLYALIANYTKKSALIVNLSYLFISIICVLIAPKITISHQNYFERLFSTMMVVQYLPSFLVGVLTRIYIKQCLKWKYIVIIFCIYILLFLFDLEYARQLQFISSSFSIFLIFIKVESIISINNFISRFMVMIGKYTLQIYLFHYYIISLIVRCYPTTDYYDFFMEHPFFTLSIGLIGAITICIICIGLMKILQGIRIYYLLFPQYILAKNKIQFFSK